MRKFSKFMVLGAAMMAFVSCGGGATKSAETQCEKECEVKECCLPVGVQLYSVRDDMAADFKGTLQKVKAMGYDGVEFAG